MNYYAILGVKPGASKNKIKKAYRLKAKKLHPDINPSPDAKKQFLKLSEAYQYLIDFRPNKPRTRDFEKKQEWRKNTQEEIRKRAEEYARMKRREFLKSKAYRINKAEMVVFEHIYYVFSIFILIGFVPTAYILGGKIWLYVSLFFWLCFWPVWTFAFKFYKLFDIDEFVDSLKIISKINGSWSLLAGFTIVWTTLFVFSNTLFHFSTLLAVAFLPIITVPFIVERAIYLKFKLSGLNRFLLIPTVICLLFCVNFYIPLFNYQTNNYELGRRFGNPPIIKLPNNLYEEYVWALMFLDEEMLSRKTQIELTTYRGILGIKVIGDYELE